MKMFSTELGITRKALILFAVWSLIDVALAVGGVYVALHFLQKYW